MIDRKTICVEFDGVLVSAGWAMGGTIVTEVDPEFFGWLNKVNPEEFTLVIYTPRINDTNQLASVRRWFNTQFISWIKTLEHSPISIHDIRPDILDVEFTFEKLPAYYTFDGLRRAR